MNTGAGVELGKSFQSWDSRRGAFQTKAPRKWGQRQLLHRQASKKNQLRIVPAAFTAHEPNGVEAWRRSL